MRPIVAIVTLMVASLAHAPGASAAVAQLSGMTLSVTAGPGEANRLVVAEEAGQLVVSESGPGAVLSAGAGCVIAGTNRVSCPAAGVTAATIDGGDLDDNLRMEPRLPSALIGGDGPDILHGGPGADLLSGGAGVDTVSYSGRANPVAVDLEGDADDGAVGELDLVSADVEGIEGGDGDDQLTGGSAPNALDGGPGADTIFGGSNGDVLTGGPGADSLDGDTGDDLLRTQDGAADGVACGSGGNDVALSDAIDLVQPDCETFDTTGAPSPSAGPLAAPPPGAPAAAAAAGPPGPVLAKPLVISRRPVRVSASGYATFSLRCVRGAGPCAGLLVLKPASRRAPLSSASGGPLARRRISLPAGRTTKVRVRLSRSGRRRVLRRRRLRCTVRIAMRRIDGSTFVGRRTVTLVASPQH